MSTPEIRQKLESMREHILDQALHDSRAILDQARAKAAAWRLEETERLEKETELILRNARTRAEEMHLRQTGAAEREGNREILRSRNRLIREAGRMLGEELTNLRQHDTYPAILRGILAESMEGMTGVDEIRVLLAAEDRHLSPDLINFAGKLFPDVHFEAGIEPAPISGGLWLLSGDGKRQTHADWDAKAQELLPLLAERLGPLL